MIIFAIDAIINNHYNNNITINEWVWWLLINNNNFVKIICEKKYSYCIYYCAKYNKYCDSSTKSIT